MIKSWYGIWPVAMERPHSPYIEVLRSSGWRLVTKKGAKLRCKDKISWLAS